MVEQASGTGSASFQPLLELAIPEVYQHIAFRLLELPVHAGERELERRRELMEKAARSQLATPAGAGRILPPSHTTDEHALRAAAHALQAAPTRLAHEFLWFWPLPPAAAAADPALRHLVAGDAAAALELWRRAVGDARPVARHNLAVWYHLQALEGERSVSEGAPQGAPAGDLEAAWRAAHGHWRALIDDEAFWSHVAERIRRIDDRTLATGAARRLRDSLPVALILIAARLAVRAMEAGRTAQAQRMAKVIADSGLPPDAASQALGIAIEPLRVLCKTLRKDANDRSVADGAQADVQAEQLLDRTAGPLAVLELLLPPTHPARVAERDEVADVALSCANRFGNAGGDPRRCLALIDRLAPLAQGAAVQQRIAFNRNAHLERLEEVVCWFCGQNERDEPLAIEVAMYGDVREQPIDGGTRTTWRHGTFKVPRCKQCVEEDHFVGRSGWMAWLVLNAGLAGAVVMFQQSAGTGLGIGAASILLAIAVAVRERRARVRKCRPGITRRARDEFPVIKQRLEQKWSFGQGPAGTA